MTRPPRTIKAAAGRSSIPRARLTAAVEAVTYGPRYVQLRNPRSDRYVKIDRYAGRVVAHKATPGPYKGVPVVEPGT